MAPHGAARRFRQGWRKIGGQPNEPGAGAAARARSASDQQSPHRGLAHGSAQPERLAGPRSIAPEPLAFVRFRSDQRRRCHEPIAARQVASGERHPVRSAGLGKGAKESIVIETRWSGESEEGPGGVGAHGREIGKIDREQAPGDKRGIEIRDEVNAFDLAVDGDRQRTGGRQDRGVVADQRGTLRGAQPAAQTVEKRVFSESSAARAHAEAALGSSVTTAAALSVGVLSVGSVISAGGSSSSSASFSTPSM